jgi:TonB family protein
MFETAVVRARVANRKLLSVSVLAHTAIVAAVIAASLASTTLPTQAPKQVLIPFVGERPLPALGNPSPPRTSAPHLGQPAAGQPRLPVLHTITAPQTIPSAIPNILPAAVAPSSDEIGDPAGKKDSIGSDPQAPADVNGPLVAGAGGVTSPVAIQRVEPIYPAGPLRIHMSGWVVLQCVIDKTGHIRDASVVHSSFGAFEQPAIDAVQKWVFTPGTLRGQPVDVIFELTVKFQVR